MPYERRIIGPWLALEWPYNIGGNPATVKVAGFERDNLTTYCAAVHRTCVECNIARDRRKTAGGIETSEGPVVEAWAAPVK